MYRVGPSKRSKTKTHLRTKDKRECAVFNGGKTVVPMDSYVPEHSWLSETVVSHLSSEDALIRGCPSADLLSSVVEPLVLGDPRGDRGPGDRVRQLSLFLLETDREGFDTRVTGPEGWIRVPVREKGALECEGGYALTVSGESSTVTDVVSVVYRALPTFSPYATRGGRTVPRLPVGDGPPSTEGVGSNRRYLDSDSGSGRVKTGQSSRGEGRFGEESTRT